MRNEDEENDEARRNVEARIGKRTATRCSLVAASLPKKIHQNDHRRFERPILSFTRHSSFVLRHLSEINSNWTSIFTRHDKMGNASHSDLWLMFRSDTMEICIVRPGTARPILNSRRTRRRTTEGKARRFHRPILLRLHLGLV